MTLSGGPDQHSAAADAVQAGKAGADISKAKKRKSTGNTPEPENVDERKSRSV